MVLRAIALAAFALFVIAVRELFVGTTSFTPIVFAELYIWLFTFVAFALPTFIRTVRRTNGDHFGVLFIAAFAGAILAAIAAPQIGEPNYCGDFAYPNRDVSVDPPRIFRCTSLPFGILGWFAGWWLALWIIVWLRNRSDGA